MWTMGRSQLGTHSSEVSSQSGTESGPASPWIVPLKPSHGRGLEGPPVCWSQQPQGERGWASERHGRWLRVQAYSTLLSQLPCLSGTSSQEQAAAHPALGSVAGVPYSATRQPGVVAQTPAESGQNFMESPAILPVGWQIQSSTFSTCPLWG